MADREPTRPSQLPRDLLGAPLAAEQLFDEREVLRAETAVAARAGAATVRPLLCRRGAVAAVRAGGVTTEFAADGRAVTPQGARDLRVIAALPSECGEHISLLGGELAVRHDLRPLRGG